MWHQTTNNLQCNFYSRELGAQQYAMSWSLLSTHLVAHLLQIIEPEKSM